MNSQELKLNAQARKQIRTSKLATQMTLIFSGGNFILAWQLPDGTLNAMIANEDVLLAEINNGQLQVIDAIYVKPDESKQAYKKRFESLDISHMPIADIEDKLNDETNEER
jgi:hypothetical protein